MPSTRSTLLTACALLTACSAARTPPPAPTTAESPAVPAPAAAPAHDPEPPSAAAEPPVRREGGLVVTNPPAARSQPPAERLRSHVEGPLTAADTRVWVGPEVPRHVALGHGTQELFLLDPQPDGGHLAVYRDPYGASTCTLDDARNCAVTTRYYGRDGQVAWTLDLQPFLSRPAHLEVQDVQLHDGTLYFNEACQSYAAGAGGACSALVAVDPVAAKALWRTRPLVSNHTFLVLDELIVAGYGFTREKDFVHLVDRATGRVLDRQPLTSAPRGITAEGSSITVIGYGGEETRFRLQPGRQPKLVLVWMRKQIRPGGR